MHLDLNAEETFLYVLNSVTVIEPLLTDAGREHPAWKAWLAHRAVVAKAIQHAYVVGDSKELDRLIERHCQLFELVEEYEGLERPKHHFQKHLPLALLRFGPLRGIWCMPWEAFLQARVPN